MTGKKEELPDEPWTTSYPVPEVNSYEGNRKKVYNADARLAMVDAGVSWKDIHLFRKLCVVTSAIFGCVFWVFQAGTDARRRARLHREDIETSVSQKPYPMPAPPRPGDDSQLHEARMKVIRNQMRDEYNEYKVCYVFSCITPFINLVTLQVSCQVLSFKHLA